MPEKRPRLQGPIAIRAIALTVAGSLSLAGSLALAASPAGVPTVPLIPRETLLNPGGGGWALSLSPDGRRLAYIRASDKGLPNIWVRTIGTADDRMVTRDPRSGIAKYEWSGDGRSLLYFQDFDGDENFHVYSIDLESGLERDLTPFRGLKAQNLLVSRRVPGEVLVGINLRDTRLFDMYRVDLATGAVVLDTPNPGNVRWWLTDHDFVIRAAVTLDPEDGSMALRVRDAKDAPWRDLIVWPFGESGLLEGYGSAQAIAFAPDGKSIYVQSALHADNTQLLRVDLATGHEKLVAAHPKASIWNITGPTLYEFAQVLLHPTRGHVQAVAFNYLVPEWQVLDEEVAADFEFLAEAQEGVVQVVDRDQADRRWLVIFLHDDRPADRFLYDRAAGTLERPFPPGSELDKFVLARTKPITFKARDGQEIPGYLTLPPGLEPRGLPLVLSVHGGPWARTDWGYDPDAQLLANRGYAVLKINFRGSAGYGKRFMNAGNGQWGVGIMQHDLTDAVKWAIAEGIADPERVAIKGGSYGGYASLAGLAFTPELYACGIVVSGIAQTRTLFQSFPDYWKPIKTRWVRRVGDVERDDELNRRISPVFHADNIRAPLLIMHGANDPRVKLQESEQIVRVMREKGLPVIYTVYPDEGHGIQRFDNLLDFLGRAEEFLAEHLGGRAQPWVEVKGSSVQLR
jgi:dipeptidyl aminopeptidase/acylaminoacyl peptidase